MSQSKQQHNLWALTVLGLLRVRPMHPYEMQRLIRDWHKDEFLELKRGSLYHAIERLREQGMIDVVEVNRDGRRPERTVYRITEAGERQMRAWLQDMLAKPVREPTQFFAALSFLPHLTPEDVQVHLLERMAALQSEIAGLSMVLKTMVPKIGRLVLIEVEYLRAMRQAELAWVKSFRQELQTGKLHWDPRLFLCHGPALPQAENV
jgi:DNA-binding PadR family transcriptional regulator